MINVLLSEKTGRIMIKIYPNSNVRALTARKLRFKVALGNTENASGGPEFMSSTLKLSLLVYVPNIILTLFSIYFCNLACSQPGLESWHPM